MAITNAQLAQAVNDLIEEYRNTLSDIGEWSTGAADGGSNSDGIFPLRDLEGVTTTAKSPSRLQADADSALNDATGAKSGAEAAQAAAETAKTGAEAAESAAQLARDVAISERSLAENAESAAQNHRNIAQLWAERAEDAEVEPGSFSALHHAAKALGFRNEAEQFRDETEALVPDVDTSGFTDKDLDETVTGSWTFNVVPGGVAAASHGHDWGDLSGIPSFASRWPSWSEVTSKPSTFTPSAHTHVVADIADFDPADFVQKDSNVSLNQLTLNDWVTAHQTADYPSTDTIELPIRVWSNEDAPGAMTGFELSTTESTGWTVGGVTIQNEWWFAIVSGNLTPRWALNASTQVIAHEGASWDYNMTTTSFGDTPVFSMGTAENLSHSLLTVDRPSDFWNTAPGGFISVAEGKGYLGHNGSHRVGLFSNGYRNSAGGFTSLGVNGNTKASGIELDPDGTVLLRAGTPSGVTVPAVATLTDNLASILVDTSVTGVLSASTRLDVIRETTSGDPAARFGRLTNQHLAIHGDLEGNFLTSRSATNNGKFFRLNATTDASDTAPSSGDNGFIFNIRGHEEVRFRSDQRMELDRKEAFRYNDSWLRLNQNGDFSSGTYTPGVIRADGGFNVDAGEFKINSGGRLQTHQHADFTFGINGSYNDLVTGDNTFGASIWAIGDGLAGTKSGPHGGVMAGNGGFGLAWYRSGHQDSRSDAREGLYIFKAGSLRAALGEAAAWFQNDVIAFSDARLKDDVEVIPNALDRISQVRGVTFTRLDNEDQDRRHTGVLAQELEAVLPEAVTTDDDGYKSVAYGNTVGLLIEAIKELKSRVESLEVS